MTPQLPESVERITAYLSARKSAQGLDADEIHTFNLRTLLISDVETVLAAVGVLAPQAVTLSMRRALIGLRDHNDIAWKVQGAAGFGGLEQTIAALRRRGLVNGMSITPAGLAAIDGLS